MGFKNIAGSVGNVQNQLTCKYNGVSKSVSIVISLAMIIGGGVWAYHAWKMDPNKKVTENTQTKEERTGNSYHYKSTSTSSGMGAQQQKIASGCLIGFGLLIMFGSIYSYFYTRDRCTFIEKLTPKQKKAYLQGQGIATATSFVGNTIASTVRASRGQ